MAELLLHVHHDGAVLGAVFFERLAGDEQEADAVVTGLHRDFVAAVEEQERPHVRAEGSKVSSQPTGSVGTSSGSEALQNLPLPLYIG